MIGMDRFTSSYPRGWVTLYWYVWRMGVTIVMDGNSLIILTTVTQITTSKYVETHEVVITVPRLVVSWVESLPIPG